MNYNKSKRVTRGLLFCVNQQFSDRENSKFPVLMLKTVRLIQWKTLRSASVSLQAFPGCFKVFIRLFLTDPLLTFSPLPLDIFSRIVSECSSPLIASVHGLWKRFRRPHLLQLVSSHLCFPLDCRDAPKMQGPLLQFGIIFCGLEEDGALDYANHRRIFSMTLNFGPVEDFAVHSLIHLMKIFRLPASYFRASSLTNPVRPVFFPPF